MTVVVPDGLHPSSLGGVNHPEARRHRELKEALALHLSGGVDQEAQLMPEAQISNKAEALQEVRVTALEGLHPSKCVGVSRQEA